MKLMFFLVIIFLLFSSCEPERYCNEPRCAYSDVNLNSPIIATLSGNMDSIIKVGDSFKIDIKLPDTLTTNYGQLLVKNILPSSFFYIYYVGNSNYWDISENPFYMDLKVINGIAPSSNDNEQKMRWDITGKEFKAYFSPTRKGKYLFKIGECRTEIKTKDNKEWLVNMGIQFQKGLPYRVSQYRDFWSADSFRNQITPQSMEQNKGYWYWFEVK